MVVILKTVNIARRPPHPASARLFIDFLFSKEAQLKLCEFNRIAARADVEPDPPRLFGGFRRVAQEIEDENLAESVALFHEVFGLPAK